jgi:hypothetical protein
MVAQSEAVQLARECDQSEETEGWKMEGTVDACNEMLSKHYCWPPTFLRASTLLRDGECSDIHCVMCLVFF